MRVWQLRSFGLDGLELATRPDPQPGPGEVLVRVDARSLNYRDGMMVEGTYNRKLALPLIPLSDGAGEVVAAGPGVTRVAVGQRVAACFFPYWESGPPLPERVKPALGGPLDGMLCEWRVLPEAGVVPVPDHLTAVQAATLPCAALTAWNALIEQGGVKPGDTVLVLGTGGVAVFALQFAVIAGARVMVVSSSDDKLQRAAQLGASLCVNYRSTPDWAAAARAFGGGHGVDHVVEVGGAGTIERSLRAVRMGGTVSVIGVVAGGGAAQTSLLPLLMQNIRLQGVLVGNRDMFLRMNRAIAQHRLVPAVDRVFPFPQAPEAFRYLAAGAHFGKVAIADSDR